MKKTILFTILAFVVGSIVTLALTGQLQILKSRASGDVHTSCVTVNGEQRCFQWVSCGSRVCILSQ